MVRGVGVSLDELNGRFVWRVQQRRAGGHSVDKRWATRAKVEIADELIDEMLVDEAARRRGIRLEPEELDAALPRDDQAVDSTTRERLQRVRQATRFELLCQRLVGGDDMSPSDKEVAAFFRDHPVRYQGRTLAQAAADIRRELTISRREARIAQLLRELRRSADVHEPLRERLGEVDIRPPVRVAGRPGVAETSEPRPARRVGYLQVR